MSLLGNPSQIFHPRNIMHSAEPEQPGNSTYARHQAHRYRRSGPRWPPSAWFMLSAAGATASGSWTSAGWPLMATAGCH